MQTGRALPAGTMGGTSVRRTSSSFITDPAYPPRPTLIQKRVRASAFIRNVPRHLFRHLFLAYISSSFVVCDLLRRGLLGCLSRAAGARRGAVPSPPSLEEFPPPRHHSLSPLAHLSIATVQSLVSTPKIPGVITGRGDHIQCCTILGDASHPVLVRSASPCLFPVEDCPKHDAFR